jgi:hypothetical protein
MTVYAAIEGCSVNCFFPAGVFKSTNGGMSWVGVNFGITDLQVVSLAVDPRNTNVLYAGTRSNGVFKSIDAGGNWSPVNPALESTLFAIVHLPIVVGPLNSGTVYVGTFNGVFKSTDGGRSWTGANSGLPASTSVFALAIGPHVAPTIAELIKEVESLDLSRGEENSLQVKLGAAQKSLVRGNSIAARKQLEAFIHEVRALERSARLDPTTAGLLISSAQAIIDSV